MQEQVLAVQRMQNYIQEHMDEEITLADLANVSYYSPWYSFRMFKEHTGVTPADYIRRLRLSKSALKLRDENCKVVDVAFQMGFQSVDGYQRAFLREFGCNPSEYAKNPIPINLFIPYGVIFSEIRKEPKKMKEVKNVFIQLVQKPERRAWIKRGVAAKEYFAYCEEVGCDVWGLIMSMCSANQEPVCMWLPKQYQKEGTSEYVQGVEVDIDDKRTCPEGFDEIVLPAAEYCRFQGEPFAEEEYCEAIEEVRQAIERYQPENIGYSWDNSNPRIQLEPMGSRGYVELVPVVKKK